MESGFNEKRSISAFVRTEMLSSYQSLDSDPFGKSRGPVSSGRMLVNTSRLGNWCNIGQKGVGLLYDLSKGFW